MFRSAVQERGLLRNREQTYRDFQERRPAILEIGGPSFPQSRDNIDQFAARSMVFLNPVRSSYVDSFENEATLVQQRIEDVVFPEGSFDMITAYLVFCGNTNQRPSLGLDLRTPEKRQAILAKLRTWLKMGGLIILETDIPHIDLFNGQLIPHLLDSTGISKVEWEAAGFQHCHSLDYRSVFHLVRQEQGNR